MSYPKLEELFQSRHNNFDFLRFVLASLVILTHSFALLPTRIETLRFLTHGQQAFGPCSVEFFFVISGFLITHSWLHSPNALDYLKKRVLRIYPGYLVAATATVFVFGLLSAANKTFYLYSISYPRLLIDFVRLHKIMDLPTFLTNPRPGLLNGSLWTIAIEFECYLLLMVVGWAGLLQRRKQTAALFLACLILYTGRLYAIPGLHTLNAHLPASFRDKLGFIACFLLGTTLYLYRDKIPVSPRLFYVSIAVLIVSALTTGFALAVIVIGSYTLFYIAFHPGIKLNNWGKKADMSYGLYLYGWPVQQVLLLWFGKSLNPYTLTLLALPGACVCATVSWFCVERPFLRLKQSSNGEKPRPHALDPTPIVETMTYKG